MAKYIPHFNESFWTVRYVGIANNPDKSPCGWYAKKVKSSRDTWGKGLIENGNCYRTEREAKEVAKNVEALFTPKKYTSKASTAYHVVSKYGQIGIGAARNDMKNIRNIIHGNYFTSRAEAERVAIEVDAAIRGGVK